MSAPLQIGDHVEYEFNDLTRTGIIRSINTQYYKIESDQPNLQLIPKADLSIHKVPSPAISDKCISCGGKKEVN